jgi:hypothetical protein
VIASATAAHKSIRRPGRANCVLFVMNYLPL